MAANIAQLFSMCRQEFFIVVFFLCSSLQHYEVSESVTEAERGAPGVTLTKGAQEVVGLRFEPGTACFQDAGFNYSLYIWSLGSFFSTE